MDRHLKKKEKKKALNICWFVEIDLKLKHYLFYVCFKSLKKKTVWEELNYGCVIQYLIWFRWGWAMDLQAVLCFAAPD